MIITFILWFLLKWRYSIDDHSHCYQEGQKKNRKKVWKKNKRSNNTNGAFAWLEVGGGSLDQQSMAWYWREDIKTFLH